jgi:hypothetical protein
MIVIDIEADLNLVDDEGRGAARLPAINAHLEPGSIAVAGRPGFWSWVEIDEIEAVSFISVRYPPSTLLLEGRWRFFPTPECRGTPWTARRPVTVSPRE